MFYIFLWIDCFIHILKRFQPVSTQIDKNHLLFVSTSSMMVEMTIPVAIWRINAIAGKSESNQVPKRAYWT